ncbi:MAG: zinc ribbon domain-containing protein [Candidatus Neomarinimicrobiota bacterium]|nr:zinc ribbon domain-containing protein [Candidatus Neomarinimicrobiota bacterium]RKY47636.1 MAG: zinc ribbon domain-containing protein [Candidatus Neomarinimicrobiota bacterium]
MPTYRYQCKKCGRVSEVFQKMSDSPLTQCQHCGGDLVRLLSPGAGFILKGEGFYVNDYKKKPGATPADKPPAKKGKEKSASPCTDCKK